MRIIAPDEMPALPAPDMALPMMTAFEFGANAQTIEPSSKSATWAISTHLAE